MPSVQVVKKSLELHPAWWSLGRHLQGVCTVVALSRGNYTSQSPSVSESASASEYSADRKVPIDFCVSSCISQSMPVIKMYPNIIKLYPFCIQIRSCKGSLNANNFLILHLRYHSSTGSFILKNFSILE